MHSEDFQTASKPATPRETPPPSPPHHLEPAFHKPPLKPPKACPPRLLYPPALRTAPPALASATFSEKGPVSTFAFLPWVSELAAQEFPRLPTSNRSHVTEHCNAMHIHSL